jgi:hypothetical protein
MTAIITYLGSADAPSVEVLGVTFVDGEPVVVDNAEIERMAAANAFFEVESDTDPAAIERRGPGRPRKEV